MTHDTKTEAELVGQIVTRHYRKAEIQILEYLSRRLAADDTAPDWALKRLAQIEAARTEIDRILGNDFDGLTRQVEDAIDRAWRLGEGAALREAQAAGIPNVLPATTARALATISADTVAYLWAMKPVALRATIDAYQTIIADSVASTILGAQTRREATRDALLRFARHGITGFTDKSGRRWAMDAYAEMATRTGVMHAHTQAHADTLSALGQRFVLVSQHGYSCPLCGPWAGRVLSLDGTPAGKVQALSAVSDHMVTVQVAGTLEQARDAGLFHPNCAHLVTLYLPGTRAPAPSHAPDPPSGYEATQTQRRIERKIRAARRREAALKHIDPQAAAIEAAEAKRLQARRRELLRKYPDLRPKYQRESIRSPH